MVKLSFLNKFFTIFRVPWFKKKNWEAWQQSITTLWRSHLSTMTHFYRLRTRWIICRCWGRASAFPSIHEQSFPLPRYCSIGELSSVFASGTRTKLWSVQFTILVSHVRCEGLNFGTEESHLETSVFGPLKQHLESRRFYWYEKVGIAVREWLRMQKSRFLPRRNF